MRSECPVCAATDAKTIDRLLVFGHGPPFIAARWGLKRHQVRRHRDECLAPSGERRQHAEADLRGMAGDLG